MSDYEAPDPHAPISVYRFVMLEVREVDGQAQVPVYVLRRAAGPFTDHGECYAERDTLAMVDFLDAFVTMPDRGEIYHLDKGKTA